ncbi:MAG: hypothetical protein ACXWF8_04450 [Methylobacter sp.]
MPVFELKSTFKGQPDYIIRIFSNGKVHYHGYTVAVVGDRYAELTKTQLNELIIYFLSLPFEKSKEYEMKRGNEIWAKTIDYKDTYTSMHMNDPVFFIVLAKKLDALINIRQWICFSKDHLQYDTSCLRYDLPDNIESFFK